MSRFKFDQGMSRRNFLAAAGTTTVAAGAAAPAVAHSRWRPDRRLPSGRMPSPIVAETPVDPADSSLGTIAWALPGPVGATTQVLGLEAMGLDADASTIGDFRGFIAYAVVAGQAKGSDGETTDVEFDVRVMQGRFIAEDGTSAYGTFGFF